jgi:hypothetical protein
MTLGFLCLIVLAMPFAVAVCAAWAERRKIFAKAYRLNTIVGDGFADVDDDSTLFQ